MAEWSVSTGSGWEVQLTGEIRVPGRDKTMEWVSYGLDRLRTQKGLRKKTKEGERCDLVAANAADIYAGGQSTPNSHSQVQQLSPGGAVRKGLSFKKSSEENRKAETPVHVSAQHSHEMPTIAAAMVLFGDSGEREHLGDGGGGGELRQYGRHPTVAAGAHEFYRRAHDSLSDDGSAGWRGKADGLLSGTQERSSLPLQRETHSQPQSPTFSLPTRFQNQEGVRDGSFLEEWKDQGAKVQKEEEEAGGLAASGRLPSALSPVPATKTGTASDECPSALQANDEISQTDAEGQTVARSSLRDEERRGEEGIRHSEGQIGGSSQGTPSQRERERSLGGRQGTFPGAHLDRSPSASPSSPSGPSGSGSRRHSMPLIQVFPPTASPPPPVPPLVCLSAGLPALDLSFLKACTASQKKEFLLSAVQRGFRLELTLKKESVSLSSLAFRKIFFPSFSIYTQTPHFHVFDSSSETSVSSESFLGKIRENLVGSECLLYGPGINPKKVEFPSSFGENLRTENLAVLYVMSPRENIPIRPIDPKKEGIIALYSRGLCKQLVCFQNKQPVWNKADGVFLEMGKMAPKQYALSVAWPFSPLQAFAIAVSTNTIKLCCE
uniref:Tubby C-terminal domain-containing protein n=1 Tax=Chromera velia CCMP2878 TaxID=1169474 RepID=A0A0G4HWX1_9ALVE|eukprot:Cvel_9157.t1-p1 / transcript=Cvel_9157.t1 / gene=Cvel_9157 / organism=Chromera_velia_CCMP2878 / gene_product=Tubby protein homolog, putative / transcript_product=Tubby protein homolog, putative / location=Cvel_scaffold521:36281-46448(-) / protein_length=606 / sequence_SO=supercontig / SO=protein_coding / is_pseudo=false